MSRSDDSAGVITSTRNKRIAAARKLRRTRVRRETGRTLIEGPFLLDEAVAAGMEIGEVFALDSDSASARTCAAGGWDLFLVSPDVMNALASSTNPRGPVAVVSVPPSPKLEARDSVVLWEISDPGNAGTIIRTAGAFGFQVIATTGSVDLWSPKVVRSAVGGHFRSPPIEGVDADLGSLVAAGLAPLIAAGSARMSVDEAVAQPGPVALIIGNEARGVPHDVIESNVATAFAVPMPGGAESLNASVAAGIVMYLRMRAR